MIRRAALFPVVLLALTAAGCISVGGGGDPVDDRAYDLVPPLRSDPVPESAGLETLEVASFTVDPALDRDELVWRRGPVEIGGYAHHRWARPPAEAARSFVADALHRAGVCSVVATDPAPERADYVLRAHLSRCEEVDGEEGWTGVVELRVVVVRPAGREEILRRVYARSVPAAVRNPGAVVEAIGQALESIGEDLAADLGMVLEAERAGFGGGGGM